MVPENAFRQIVEQWYDPLYRFAYSLCRNPDDALDRTQNAFFKLAQNADSIRDQNRVKSWLFSVLHRDFIDDYRHERRFPKTSLHHVTLSATSNPPPSAAGLDAAQAIRCLKLLEPRFRAPLSLFYLQDFSYKEIAKTLDIPIGTVMSRLRRAKDQLRDLLESDNCDGADFRASAHPLPQSHS